MGLLDWVADETKAQTCKLVAGARAPSIQGGYQLITIAAYNGESGRESFGQDACTASSEQGGWHGASGYPGAGLWAGAAAQHLGPRGADSGDRRHGADRLRRRADGRAFIHPRN